MPVHHYGKDASSGLLGSHIFRAGADVILSVLADREQATGNVKDRTLSLAKSRAGLEGPIAPFELELVLLGRTRDGEEFGTCAVKPNLDAEPKAAMTGKKPGVSRGERALKDAIGEAFGNKPERVHVQGNGPLVSAVRVRHVREAFVRFYVAGEDEPGKKTEATRKAFMRALNKLPAAYGMGSWAGEEWIWLI